MDVLSGQTAGGAVQHGLNRLAIILNLPSPVIGAVIGYHQFHTFHADFLPI